MMSFSSYCKDEASKIKIEYGHCKIALLEALLRENSEIIRRGSNFVLSFSSSLTMATTLFCTLMKELYNQNDLAIITKESNRFGKQKSYIVEIEDASLIIQDLGLLYAESPNHKDYESRECCIKAYLRGAFIACGSVNDPAKSDYHLELALSDDAEAIYVLRLINHFDLNAKLIKRRNDFIIYIKEVEKIKDFLRIIGITQMVFKFEEVQIQREFKNDLNRKVNSEIANEMKTLSASRQQLAYIQYLEYNYPLEKMDPKILLIMKVRKEHPDSSFKELIDILNNEYQEPITKSGLNHRFRKIKELAEEIKHNKEA